MKIAEHIRHLESIIIKGEKLRDDMRRTAESREAIIRNQAGKIKQLSKANELYRMKRSKAAQRLHKARCDARSAEAKLKKQIRRYDEQEIFYAAIKAAANETGAWKALVSRAKEIIGPSNS